jgi:hypothetical protein
MQVYRTRAKAVSSRPIFNAGTERFIRDWRSAIVTVTVRDQRYRQHDPILGVVPLKLANILETSSQVTRWYPLDGGVGFGRIRISLLFRSVETRLPPNMLGWEVGTFEFMSNRILGLNYQSHTKLKLRTGGSTGVIPRNKCIKLDEGDGVYWDLATKDGNYNIKLPVKHRYRSPVVFEFHTAGKRGAAAYALIWLHHLTDNETVDIDIPIWTTKNGNRLTQNYVTEVNYKAKEVPGLEDLTEVGRLQFRARFKAGIDESHEAFVVDNDSRETFETWEACLAEGVRDRQVTLEIPERLNDLHDESLTEGRDILKQADPEERQKWVSKSGEDWSGAFGEDPKAYTDGRGRKIAEPGRDKPPHDPYNPSSDEDNNDDLDDSDTDESDPLGIQDASTKASSSMNGDPRTSVDTRNTNGTLGSEMSQKARDRANKKSEQRKQRGLMQWKPARNVKFAKDEAGFALKKVKSKLTGGLEGRQPGVETEA